MLSMLLGAFTIFAVAEEPRGTSARAMALYDPVRGVFLCEKNADERLPMASTTKIMTALLAIERCDRDEIITIPSEATHIEGSSLYLEDGDRVRIGDLIYAVMLASANDAATALAIYMGGDTSTFAKMMNDRAFELGMTNTSFENPHGLDSEEHYTTAHDLAKLAAAALDNAEFRKISSTYKHRFYISDTPHTVVNHNKLLKRLDCAIGVKTGYTSRSGRCLVGAAEKNELRLITVTLDDPNDWSDHEQLLEYGFSQYEQLDVSSLLKSNLEATTATVPKLTIPAALESGQTTVNLLHGEIDKLKTEIVYNDGLMLPICKGDIVGYMNIISGASTIGKINIISTITVDSSNFTDMLKKQQY